MLVCNSNLPSPRGNLELAWAFADSIEAIDVGDVHWELLFGWLAVTEREAPVGDPREFLRNTAKLTL